MIRPIDCSVSDYVDADYVVVRPYVCAGKMILVHCVSGLLSADMYGW